jgi:GT2 family glycosyltransferase
MSVAVIVPTFGRGRSVLGVLRRISSLSSPLPDEVIVHADQSDGTLEQEIAREFPAVTVLSSPGRIGPGGGRHRCLIATTCDYAISLDDDSWPVDADFLARAAALFSAWPDVAVIGASIWHRGEKDIARTARVLPAANFVGCGHAIRVAAYRSVRGYLARPIAYGMEESDLSLQLFATGWKIVRSEELRVFHDTDRLHHNAQEITAGQITNLGLGVFLNYPLSAWGLGALQLGNAVKDAVVRRRFRGIAKGLARIPGDCIRHSALRHPVSRSVLRDYRRLLAGDVEAMPG